MKRFTAKIVALILAAIMLLSVMPLQAAASLKDNDPKYNREVLEALTALVGSEDEARAYYDTLERYGLLDEDGTLMESWSIQMDGEDITLGQLKEILSGEYDHDKYVFVDGDPVTLEDVAVMIAIEDYIAYLRATYFKGGEWTEAQKDYFASLVEQVETKGITFNASPAKNAAPESGLTLVSPGVDQAARIAVTSIGGGRFRASLTGAAEGQETSFAYRITGVTCKRSDGENLNFQNTVEMPAADENGCATAEFGIDLPSGVSIVPSREEYLDGVEKLCVMVNVYDVYNALFTDEEGKGCRAANFVYLDEDWSGQGRSPKTTVRLEAWQSYDGVNNPIIGWELPVKDASRPRNSSEEIRLREEELKRVLDDIKSGYYPDYKLEATLELRIPTRQYGNKVVPYPTGGVLPLWTIVDTWFWDYDNILIYPGAIHPGVIINGWGDWGALDVPQGEPFTYKGKDYVEANGNQKIEYVYTLDVTSNPRDPQYFSSMFYPNGAVTEAQLRGDTDYDGATVVRVGFPQSTTHTTVQGIEEEMDWGADVCGGVVYNDGGNRFTWSVTKATAVFSDSIAASLSGVNVVSGNYVPGMGIPVVLKFSEPVIAEKCKIKVNGQILNAVSSLGNGQTQVFIYEVKAGDLERATLQGYYCEDLFGNPTDRLNGDVSTDLQVNIDPCDWNETFTGVHAYISNKDKDGNTAPNTLIVDVDVSTNADINNWILSAIEGNQNTGWTLPEHLFVKIFIPGYEPPEDDPDPFLFDQGEWFSIKTLTPKDGANTDNMLAKGAKITGTYQLGLDEFFRDHPDVSSLDCVVSLYYSPGKNEQGAYPMTALFGRTASVKLTRPVLVDPADIRYRVTVDYPDDDLEDIDMIFPLEDQGQMVKIINVALGGDPDIRVGILLDGKEYTYGDTSRTTIFDPEQSGVILDYTAHFVFKEHALGLTPEEYEDESVHQSYGAMDQDGYFNPNGVPGIVSVVAAPLYNTFDDGYLHFGNNWFAFNFEEGYQPYLAIPGARRGLRSGSGKDATIYWNTNIPTLNGETPTTYHIEVSTSDAKVFETDIGCDINDPIGHFTIPGGYLSYSYTNSTFNHFTATVTTEYNGREYSASIPIEVFSAPAEVRFTYNGSYSILDTAGFIDIPWVVTSFSNFDADSDLFEMQIVKSGSGKDAANVGGSGATAFPDLANSDFPVVIKDPGKDDGYGNYEGSYRLYVNNILASPSDPTSFRDVYVITIRAKNGNDSTWSYDSILLYVYDEEALRIYVDGEADGDGSLLMTNRDKIPLIYDDDPADIIALNRNITLRSTISANYSEYAWGDMTDRMAWKSSDHTVASVNYQKGDMYDDIENLSYVYYRPTQEFILSGLKDGEADITVTHAATGMKETLHVTVETLTGMLYLFQFTPRTRTEVRYFDGNGDEHQVFSDDDGALAIYSESGIEGIISCASEVTDDNDKTTVYLSSFRAEDLASGERDSTQLLLYPCNYLQLREAAHAYVYIKASDDQPVSVPITFRGGVYVNDSYVESALFALNENAVPYRRGDTDQFVNLGADGKLDVLMDQTQWNLGEGRSLRPGDKVTYAFLLKCGTEDTAVFYPLLIEIDATVNEKTYISKGDAVVSFRLNEVRETVGPYDTIYYKHPFLIRQYVFSNNTSVDLLHKRTRIGINDTSPECTLTNMAMWWGETDDPGVIGSDDYSLQLFTSEGKEIAPDSRYHKIYSSKDGDGGGRIYPFIDEELTTYELTLNADSLKDAVDPAKGFQVYMEFYRKGDSALVRKEDTKLTVVNLMGVGAVTGSANIRSAIEEYGSKVKTDSTNSITTDDEFVDSVLNLISKEGNVSDGEEHLFQIKVAPTEDPTKFLGFVQVNVGERIENESGNGISFLDSEDVDVRGEDTFTRIKQLLTQRPSKWALERKREKFSAKTNKAGGSIDKSFAFGGNMEVLIYYDFTTQEWEMQPLNGGFYAGFGLEYTKVWNKFIGYVPFTMELRAAGNIEIGMNAITASYYSGEYSMGDMDFGTEFLTELRVYMYLRLFAGVGVDYSVFAVKLGIFGQISLDLQFKWLNRPYLESNPYALIVAAGEDEDGYPNPPTQNTEPANLSGQHITLNGQIGIELVIRALFLEVDWTLFSYSFDALNRSFNDYDGILTHWENNQKNLQAAIQALLDSGDAEMLGGTRNNVAVKMSPRLESRDYLDNEERVWGFIPRRGPANPINNLESNTYPYAGPELTRDGEILVFLTDQNSTDVADTRAAFARNGWPTYEQGGVIDDGGFGDSQISVDGTGSFAIAAWTRQMTNLKKEAGAVLTDGDQRLMLNGSDVVASVYDNGVWTTTRLTDNFGADVAPTVAVSGSRGIVAWRSVVSGQDSLMNFTEKDTIVYRVYEQGEWSEERTLYNGTSGTVKAITSAIMTNGNAAVAYTLDVDSSDDTITDREIVYAVIGKDGEVIRNVRATNDDKLDENPQLTAVIFPHDNAQHFLLGWYTQKVTDGSATGNENTDICLLDFNAIGVTDQLIPESMSKIATAPGVAVSSNFRFTKNAASITDLSLIWVERDEEESEYVSYGSAGSTGQSNADDHDISGETIERDVLKGIKFYLYGNNNKLIGLTDALRIAEMSDATLIDHFDAYTYDGTTIKAVVLGTTYGKNGQTESKTGVTESGKEISYTVPMATSAMYTAVDSYENGFDVEEIAVEYDSVILGHGTEIGFRVHNSGYEPITAITANVGGNVTSFPGYNVYSEEYDTLELLPGHSADFWAGYTVPLSGVVNPEFNVAVTFGESGTIELPEVEILNMDLPDLEISGAEIIDEENGERTVRVKLYNRQDAALYGSGRKVRLSFYKDSTYENKFEDEYLPDIIIDSPADLKMIDEGGYSTQFVFDVASYLKDKAKDEDERNSVEIPENGLFVYVQADVIQNVDDKDLIVPEPNENNNLAQFCCENLRVRTGKEVTVTNDIAVSGGNTTVTVHLQNTSLQTEQGRNLIVYLLDEDGAIIAQKEAYDEDAGIDHGLITLDCEAKCDVVYTFDTVGTSIICSFTDLRAAGNTSDLSGAEFRELGDITVGELENGAEITVDDLTRLHVDAIAQSTFSTVTVTVSDGGDATTMRDISSYTYQSTGTVALKPGEDTLITIRVDNPTAEGEKTKTYTLTIHNNGAPRIDMPTYYIVDGNTAVLSVNASPLPATPGYEIGYHWYSCDENGEGRVEIPVCTGALTSTVTVTDDFGSSADPKYYVCEITRELLDGTVITETYFTEPVVIFYGKLITITPFDLTKEYGKDDVSGNDDWIRWYRSEDASTDTISDERAVAMGFADHDEFERVRTYFLNGHLSFTREQGEDVGTYTITPVFDARYWEDIGIDGWSDGTTYYFVGCPSTFTITPKPITVTAVSASKAVGDPDPEFTAVIDGLHYTDDQSVISYTFAREKGETEGTYAVTVSGERVQGNYEITFFGGELFIGEIHDHDGIGFLPWNDPEHLPDTPGNYYLNCDVESYGVRLTHEYAWDQPDENDPIYGVYNICLNGHRITCSYIEVDRYTVLNLYDDTGSGVITRDGRWWDYGIVLVEGIFNMHGGTIRDCNASRGAGVTVFPRMNGEGGRNGIFNMYGGTIRNNSVDFENGINSGGGGVSIEENGVFNMYGGTIRDNTASYGGAVRVSSGSAFNMYGGEITDNTAVFGGAIACTDYSGGYGSSLCRVSGGAIERNIAVIKGDSIFGDSTEDDGYLVEITGGKIVGGGAKDNVDVASGKPEFRISGAPVIGGTIRLKNPAKVTGSLAGVYTVLLDDDGDPTVGMITEDLSGNGTAGMFISGDPEYAVTTTDGGEAQLVLRSSVTAFHTVTFANSDGHPICTVETPEGEIPVYPEAVPTKAPTSTSSFEFAGWADENDVTYPIGTALPEADSDAVYTAYFTEIPRIAFKAHALMLASEIGVKFRVSIPEGYDASGIYVDFVASDGRTGRVTFADSEVIPGSPDRYFNFYINAMELAETITATLHYGDGLTAANEYSAMEYIVYVREHMSDNAKLIALVDALQSYGYYLQGSGWTDDLDHVAIPAPENAVTSEDIADAIAALDGYKSTKNFGTSGVNNVKMSLLLNEQTTVRVSVRVDEGVTIVSEGYTAKIIDGDTYYEFCTAKIGPKNLGAPYTVTVLTDSGTASVTVSAMTYVRAALNSSSVTEAKKLALAAYYMYYVAAYEY